MDRKARYAELHPVHRAMISATTGLRGRGIPVQFVPGSELTLMAYLNLSPDLGGALQATFLVQWNEDTRTWSVHRLMYRRVTGGFQRADPPAVQFGRLPDSRWFTAEIQAWVDHELREGLFAPAGDARPKD